MGLSNVLAKGLLAHFEPMSFLLVESIGSSLLLWAMLLWQRKRIVLNPQLIKYSLLGLMQPGLAYIFGVYGLSLTTANSDSLVWSAETIVIIFLSWLVFRERIGWLIFFSGCLWHRRYNSGYYSKYRCGQSPSMVLGNLLILGGVLCAAIYAVGTQHQLIKIEPLYLMTLHQTCSLIVLLGVWLVCLPILHPFSRDTTQLDCLLGMVCGMAQFALPFCLFLMAIKGLGAARSSIFLVLPPIFTICRLASLFWANG